MDGTRLIAARERMTTEDLAVTLWLRRTLGERLKPVLTEALPELWLRRLED